MGLFPISAIVLLDAPMWQSEWTNCASYNSTVTDGYAEGKKIFEKIIRASVRGAK